MFVLNASEERRDTFKRSITINKPSDDESGYTEHQLTLVFQDMPQSMITELLTTPNPDRPFEAPDTRLLMGVVVGWEGVMDHQGNALPFTADNARRLFDIPYLRGTAAADFIHAMNGDAKSDRKRKN